MKRRKIDLVGLSALAGSFWIASALAAPAPPPPEDIDLSILDMAPSEEEQMVYGTESAVPETGNENPEDYLSSSPVVAPASPKRSKKTAELPKALPVAPGSKEESFLTPSDLGAPIPEETASAEDPGLETQSDADPVDDSFTAAEELEETLAPEEEVLPAADESYAAEPLPPSGSSTTRASRRTPLYEREKPNWGVDIHGSLAALGATSPAPADTTEAYETRNFGLGFEWQPKFFQSMGVLSIGPSFNLYIVEPMGDFVDGPLSIASLGGSIKYQFNYFHAQPFVPFVGYEVQVIRYRFIEPYPTGITTSTGFTFGGLLLLNWMEPSAAHSLWSDTGIKRSYLVGEVKTMTAGEPALSIDGSAIYFGLRLEL